jgi:uncharacterized protein (TIGR02147 family)
VTMEKAVAWAGQLNLAAHDRQKLFRAITEDRENRVDPTKRRERAMEQKMEYVRIQIDQFATIADWWHFGLLNLVNVKTFRSDVAWMSEQLGISTEDCVDALARLKRLGLLSDESGSWKRTSNPLETPSDIPSKAIRGFHRQNIRRALASIESVPVQDRDITSIMVVTNKAKLAEAKKRIRVFRKELADFLDADGGDEVYSLNIQLFPQTKGNR